jgi:hypothetical protein
MASKSSKGFFSKLFKGFTMKKHYKSKRRGKRRGTRRSKRGG